MPTTPLAAADADYVCILHTDMDLWGQPVPSGTVDMYANDGRKQPGCPPAIMVIKPTNGNIPLKMTILIFRLHSLWLINSMFRLRFKVYCDHERALFYFTENMKAQPGIAFPAARAASWDAFKAHSTDDSKIAFMDIDCPIPSTNGDYFFQTNSQTNFSRGMAGITYAPPAPATLLSLTGL